MTARSTAQRELRWVWVAAEGGLVAVSMVSMLTLRRIFEDTSFIAPLAFTVAVAHVVAIAMRWFGLGVAVSALVSFIGVVLAIVATHYSTTALAVVAPTGATLDQASRDLEVAGEVFRSLQSPVPSVTGFIVISSLAFWLVVFVADWAAFRLMSPGQALIPAVTVVIFVSLLGVEDGRVSTTATTVVVSVLFVLAHRAASRAVEGIWLDRGPMRGYLSIVTAGLAVAFIASLVGITGGPSVPGADEAPLVELGDEGRRDSNPIEVISPLVQIQPRLIDQSDRVLFTVETTDRAYWRIAALDVFDGSLWRSQGQFRGTDDGLDVQYAASVPTTTLTSTFDLQGLNVVWAPAAYVPVALDNLSDVDLNYEAETATFIVDTSAQRVSDGLVYRVESRIGNFTPALLRHLPDVSAERVDARYLALPTDYSPLARSTAEQLTAGMTDAYDKALALQNYFRDNFVYDVDVAKGHDIRRLEDFLTVQRGYCEQFAGTYASMARAIGLPARVATGFTPGDQDPSNPDRYIVRGRHAHAWPEVFIAGAGWVGFEPTPGRGAPNATDYTGVPESQESAPDAGSGDTNEIDQAAETEGIGAAPTPTPSAPDPVVPDPADLESDPDPENEARPNSPSRAPLTLMVWAVIAALWAWAVPALKRWKVAQRANRIGDDRRHRITLAWSRVVDRLEAEGHPPTVGETLVEYSDRVGFSAPVTFAAFDELTALTVGAAYGDAEPESADVERADQLASAVIATLDGELPWLVRGAHSVDPRPLLRLRDRVDDRAERLASGATAAPGSNDESSDDSDVGDPLLNA